MKIICISGKARHGKTITAGILKDILEAHNRRVLVTNYADLLKYICKTFFNWGGEKDEHGRHLLQYIGTDVVRKQRPTYWVDFIISILRMFPHDWDYVIIPDCRFPNEIELLDNKFKDEVTHLRIVRPNFESDLTEEQKEHPSETALDNVTPDYTFYNVGTLEVYEGYVRAVAPLTIFKEETYAKANSVSDSEEIGS